MRPSKPRTIHAILTDEPKTRAQIAVESGLSAKEVRLALRGMRTHGQAVESDTGVIRGPNGFRKQWASHKEKQAHYARSYRERAMADTGELGQRYRETVRRNEAKRQERVKAERITAMAERIGRDNATKRAKAAVRAEAGRLESASRSLSDKLRATDAMASRPIVAPQRQSVEEFMAAGGVVDVIPSQIGHAYSGLNPYRLTLV